MADHSTIEWTDATWNPITGCSIVSPGCTNCYAMKLAGSRLKHIPSREGLTRDTKAGPVWTGEVRFNSEWIDQPIKWRRPRRIFVCAHGDLFAEGVPDEWIDQVFGVMGAASHHTFQVLTKRPERMRDYLRSFREPKFYTGGWTRNGEDPTSYGGTARHAIFGKDRWPLPNVWLGTSVEDQRRADERIPFLLETPAAVRFTSAEPLVGSLDIEWALSPNRLAISSGLLARGHFSPGLETLRPLDWVIVGGESGPGARPMRPDWARSLRDQCEAAGTAYFFKQWGSFITNGQADTSTDYAIQNGEASNDYLRGKPIHVGKKAAGRLLDGVEHNGMPGRAAMADGDLLA